MIIDIDFIQFVLYFTISWMAMILLFMLALKNLKIADRYRKKYGFDVDIESKHYKEKELDGAKKRFEKRSVKL